MVVIKFIVKDANVILIVRSFHLSKLSMEITKYSCSNDFVLKARNS